MKIYCLQRKQFLSITLAEAWDFFSSPKNLAAITPAHMKFKILHISGGPKMYTGQLIQYRINILPGVPADWTTEITKVDEPNYFADTQLAGPYKLWHHQHFFQELNGGVEMTDEINYAIPLGILGRLANSMFVNREVNRIFDHRFKVLEQLFGKKLTV
jgi:ligand-binding SRPBCC domain-containing protein